MKLFTAAQIRNWDLATIAREPIASIDLMERAATRVVEYLMAHHGGANFAIFCGVGNNGGDGLAIARMLHSQGLDVAVFLVGDLGRLSSDAATNLARLGMGYQMVASASDFPSLGTDTIIVDALFGSGLNRPIVGLAEELIHYLNGFQAFKISIDIPSGLFADCATEKTTVFTANLTLSFQVMKYAFFLPENYPFVGDVKVLDIGLNKQYYEETASDRMVMDLAFVRQLYRVRNPFGHKGTYGHALLIAGNLGKMGAAVMMTKACLFSGVGLLSVSVPFSENAILPLAVPEAMTVFREEAVDWGKYSGIGFGPGLGMGELDLLKELLTNFKKPILLDADGLNLVAANPALLELIPNGSILSPHPKEFDRLFGESKNTDVRIQEAIAVTAKQDFVLILKGHHTVIAYQGRVYINTTGNVGMATGGSGDTLSGMLTALLAQGYSGLSAAILGVYLHGLSADLLLSKESYESVTPSKMMEQIGVAFLVVSGKRHI